VRNVVKTLLSIIVTWGFALIVLPTIVVAIERHFDVPRMVIPGHRVGAPLLFLGGCAVGLASAWFMATVGNGTPLPFDAAAKLVVQGPYRYVRNPMAIGGIGQSFAVAFFRASYGAVLYSIAAGFIWHFWIRPPEEQFLAERFGAEYSRYHAVVKLWLPRPRPFRPERSG
jgi:protein-S-isoprenylcysteine O-methyltransferase Ste14